MPPPQPVAPGRPAPAARKYEPPPTRPALPLAVLVLWGGLLLLGTIIHPTAKRGEPYQATPPLFIARGPGVDFYQFWIVGVAESRLHPANIYSSADRRQMAALGHELARPPGGRGPDRLTQSVGVRGDTVETLSTPFLYAALSVFATGQYDRDFDYFLDACLAAFAFAVIAIGWTLGYTLAESLLFVAAALFWCEPLSTDLRVGNVNQLQLAAVAVYVLLLARPAGARVPGGRRTFDVLGGLVLGLLVAFKPTLAVVPLVLAVTWVIDRRWDTLITQGVAAAAAAAAAVVIGCLYLHSGSAWWDWKNALGDLESVSDVSVANGNYTLARMLLERPDGSVGFDVAPVLLIAGLGLTGTCLVLTRQRSTAAAPAAGERQARFDRDFLATALGCALSVLTLKLAWQHYYLLLIPLLLYVLRPGTGVRPDSGPGARVPVAFLGLGLVALAATFSRPVAFLFDLDTVSRRVPYVAGAWALLVLGLAALWFPGYGLKKVPAARQVQ